MLKRVTPFLGVSTAAFLIWGTAMAAQAPGAPPPTPDAAAREAAAAAAAAKANIEVTDGWTRATPANATTAAIYFRIVSVKDADRLIGAKAAYAEKAEIHSTTNTNGTVRMAPVANVPIPAAGTVGFTPAGNHLMLTGLKAPLRQGDSFLVTLDFEKAGSHTTVVRIAAANALGPPATAAAGGRDITSGATQPNAR